MINLEDDLGERYLSECQDYLFTIETHLLAFESSGAAADKEAVDSVFLAIRAIKGEASLFDLPQICALAAQMEDALAPIRHNSPSQDRVSSLLRATERLRELIQRPERSNREDISETLAALSTLPRDDAGEHAGKQTSPQAPFGGRTGGPLRMLLVEDDFTSRLLLQTFLSRYGDCHIAVNGREAVAAFRAASEQGRKYDMVCMDIMMPEMDGHEALQQIRALEVAQGIFCNHGAKIVMTTTVAQVKQVVGCFRELCDAYLLKPIDLTKLLSLMKSYELIA